MTTVPSTAHNSNAGSCLKKTTPGGRGRGLSAAQARPFRRSLPSQRGESREGLFKFPGGGAVPAVRWGARRRAMGSAEERGRGGRGLLRRSSGASFPPEFAAFAAGTR